jgi:hypothetical protein
MKACITGLLKGRITRWGTLAAALAAVGMPLAVRDHPHYRTCRSLCCSEWARSNVCRDLL